MSDCICFPTLAAAHSSSPTIPAGTPAVVVEQFDSNSAVSHALYLPTLLGTAPSHSLYFQNGTTYWVIHPDYISLEAAGAPPPGPPPGGDCAPAMARILQYFSATGIVALKLWERDYILNSISVLNPAPGNSAFTIIGRGQKVSRFVVPGNVNANGALAITFPDTNCQYMLSGISVIATGATTSPVNCGTAILMNVNTGGALLPREQFGGIIERIHIGPELDPVTQDGWAYFNKGLDLTGTARPLVSQTTIGGCSGPDVDSDYSDTSAMFAAQSHLVLDNCYSPMVRDTRLWHANLGVSFNCTAGTQGFEFTGSNIEGVRTGIYVRNSNGQNPYGRIGNSVIQFRDTGLDIGNVTAWSFPANAFFLQGDIQRQFAACDMRFVNAGHITITGATFATFCGTGGDQNCGNRVNIIIGSQDPGTSNEISFLIDGCIFGDRSNYFALSAIQLNPTAQNIQIGASNIFDGIFTQPVVNDIGGAAVTLVGFPTSNNPANPAAVVPNGNVNIGQPTLGSANVPWPITFNYLHTIPISSTEPAAPASGYVLYTITTVENVIELWAKSSDGSRKQLAP